MTVRFALITCLLASSAAPVLAQDNVAVTATPPAKEKKICQTDEDTGSIMPHRVCHTKAEWAEIDKENTKNNSQFSNSISGHSGMGH